MPQIHFLTPVGEDQLLQTHLAALALFDADDQCHIEAQFLEHAARHADLAASAVNQHQIGQARRAAARGASSCLRGHLCSHFGGHFC